jgi:hypothetical protein
MVSMGRTVDASAKTPIRAAAQALNATLRMDSRLFMGYAPILKTEDMKRKVSALSHVTAFDSVASGRCGKSATRLKFGTRMRTYRGSQQWNDMGCWAMW